ncbi:MAG: hypothetical protein LE180_00105 [Endomicrobium sp.]|uniref:hypothetical protein n=1 Tax=Candidatus Endomicrobiellum pyrsonymphae TaxID=1408203 RepID=UPI0035834523|nr:hypothetical protein [Endomicrobium sp.]
MKVKRPKNFNKNYPEAVEQKDEKKTLKHKESNVLYKPTYEWCLKTATIVLVSLAIVFFY